MTNKDNSCVSEAYQAGRSMSVLPEDYINKNQQFNSVCAQKQTF